MSGLEGPNACPRIQGLWSLRGNLFALAGRSHGLIAGVSNNYQVLASNGDWFQLGVDYNNCSGSPGVDFQGNVFALTGVTPSPGEEFLVFDGGYCVGEQYAITTAGNIFGWLGCSGWFQAGALPLGPTKTVRKSWGELKLIYR